MTEEIEKYENAVASRFVIDILDDGSLNFLFGKGKAFSEDKISDISALLYNITTHKLDHHILNAIDKILNDKAMINEIISMWTELKILDDEEAKDKLLVKPTEFFQKLRTRGE